MKMETLDKSAINFTEMSEELRRVKEELAEIKLKSALDLTSRRPF